MTRILLRQRIDPHRREQRRVVALRPHRVQDHLDPGPRQPHPRRVAERHHALAEAHLRARHEAQHLHRRIHRRAGEGRRLRPEAQRNHRALAGHAAELHRHRIPDRPDRDPLGAPRDQLAQDHRRIARGAAAGIVPGVGDDHRPAPAPPSPAPPPRARPPSASCAARDWRRAPVPSRSASAAPCAGAAVGDRDHLRPHLRHVARP